MRAISIVLALLVLGAGGAGERTAADASQRREKGKTSNNSALCMRQNYDKYLNHKHGPVLGQPIDVEVELAQYRFVIGEPIMVRVTLTNQTLEPVSTSRDENFLRLYLSQDGKNFYEYQGEELFISRKYREETLKPGESWVFERTVLYCPWSEDQLVIREAGKYHLFADFGVGFNQERIYDSDVISFQVEAPSKDDAEVFQLLRGDDGTYKYYGYFIKGEYSGGMELVKMVERFDRLIQQYPGSTYASGLRTAMQQFLERTSPGTKPEMRELFSRLRAQYLPEPPQKKP